MKDQRSTFPTGANVHPTKGGKANVKYIEAVNRDLKGQMRVLKAGRPKSQQVGNPKPYKEPGIPKGKLRFK